MEPNETVDPEIKKIAENDSPQEEEEVVDMDELTETEDIEEVKD